MAAPPLLAGELKVTVAEPIPGVTSVTVGAPGTFGNVTPTPADDGPLPTALKAKTVQANVPPAVSPVTFNGEAPPLADWLPQVAV